MEGHFGEIFGGVVPLAPAIGITITTYQPHLP